MARTLARRPRVLLVNLDPVASVGMRRLLDDGGVDVVEEPRALTVVDEAVSLRPDAVVLPLEPVASALGAQIRARVPSTKVLLISRDESELRVLDPGATVARRLHRAVPFALLEELAHCQPAEEE